MKRETIFSPCRKYRYSLWRDWTDDVFELEEHSGNNSARFVQFIGLNPSIADETTNDPTIRRCIGFAQAWGFGALCMTNLFAWRDTKPKNMKRAADPIGSRNDGWIVDVALNAGLVVAAWGNNGTFLNRSAEVLFMLRAAGVKVHVLGTNNDGSPCHPLFLKKILTPVPLK